jgi:RimJ/RimL family protein N-acetyltransferase
MVEIKLQHGKIRELKANDLPSLVSMCQDRDIQDSYFVTGLIDLERYWHDILKDQQKLRNAKGLQRDKYHLPIEHDGEVAGLLTFDISQKVYSSRWIPMLEINNIDLSYFVGQKFRGNGIAADALSEAVHYAFSELDAAMVYASCLKENIASQNLLMKVGLERKFEGVAGEGPLKGRKVVLFACSLQDYYQANGME